MRDLKYWQRVVLGATRGLTKEQVDAAAKICMDTETATGASCGAWHAAAIVCGTPCHCAQCNPGVRYV